MRGASPPVRLPHAADLLAFRERADIRSSVTRHETVGGEVSKGRTRGIGDR
ncbi:hypothetical protein [Actinoplanes sp. GCM10030250]|uniref:hypothetical protein n=1 Tax=Actinoplanes sp. GCM10030250 TaxID=3273376 RepID=UPI0036236B1C